MSSANSYQFQIVMDGHVAVVRRGHVDNERSYRTVIIHDQHLQLFCQLLQPTRLCQQSQIGCDFF